MALAVLCSEVKKLQRSKPEPHQTPFHFQAFIVDHGARPESSVEAQRVSQYLHKRSKLPLPYSPAQANIARDSGEDTENKMAGWWRPVYIVQLRDSGSETPVPSPGKGMQRLES